MTTCRFRVHGHVQGVGFRWWTRTQAERLAITGSVRNLPDGSVQVEATGSEAAIETLRRLLHRGPDGASVERVEEERGSGELHERGPTAGGGFRIVH